MPLYIPWLTETIKKRGVRYLLHHYLGQFFEEKLTLEQLSIDIYEGRGSIRNLALDVDGLNDELDFIPFKFLEGCLIGQISVEVPWSSLATDACRVELDGAKFYCRLKTSADASKAHCTESTLLSRSLMTSSMQMAEEIVTTEDDEDNNDLTSSIHHHAREHTKQGTSKDANQMFEGLEMFAQLIDSVLRRTKLTARDTLFQIKPHHEDNRADAETDSSSRTRRPKKHTCTSSTKSSGDEFSEPLANSDTESEDDSEQSSRSADGTEDEEDEEEDARKEKKSEKTVEFFIRFFRCEEMIDETTRDMGTASENHHQHHHDEDEPGQAGNKSLCALPETITKLLTLEDVEMRIDGRPVSNLVGKHTITIKFNGQKSEISIFSGSPLLAVISHRQLETFFNVFDGSGTGATGAGTSTAGHDMSSSFATAAAAAASAEQDQKLMGPEDYARIENQLLEQSASLRNAGAAGGGGQFAGGSIGGAASVLGPGGLRHGARRWVESGELYSDMGGGGAAANSDSTTYKTYQTASDKLKQSTQASSGQASEPTLDHIEAFSCELKLPGIWLCLLRDGEALPSPLIKPHADSINSFQSINKYIDSMIKFSHLRLLALKVALDITATGTQIFLGDLDISEHLQETSEAARMSPVLKLLNNDQANIPMSSARYRATIVNGRDITVDLLAKTRLMFDPTIIDRLVYDYQLIKMDQLAISESTLKSQGGGGGGGTLTRHRLASSHTSSHQRNSTNNHPGGDHLNLTIRGEQAKIELLCPIPDLRPDAHTRRTQLRPQSFLFNLKDFNIAWHQADKLKLSSSELTGHVKSSPQQADSEAVKFLEASGTASDKCLLLIEPSPSNLLDNDDLFTRDIEQALNESSMYESIYVSQATESKIPTEPFQTKRKVVRASFQTTDGGGVGGHANTDRRPCASECDHEKILTPGERQHLLDYLQQTMASTKLSLNLHLPICEVEFEDKEQLDLIYNRFGNDFVFWQPRALSKQPPVDSTASQDDHHLSRRRRKQNHKSSGGGDSLEFRRPMSTQQADEATDDDDDDEDVSSSDADNEGSEVSFHSMSHASPGGECTHRNEVTCKVVVDELFVKFNHQSCAAALKQEITADNFLMGVVIDVNGKPSTLLSLVADKLDLSTDLETVLGGNSFASKDSIFALTAEIKRPTRALKDIKLALQLRNGLLNDFRTETYTRFWQSINVTDEPILGYVAPQIVTELHIDILETGLLLVRDGARPALLSMDEIYLTSMVVAETSQVMIRLIADEVSLYMKRDKSGLEVMKNYICLIDSGLIDLDVKFGGDQERLEFGVINNVITVRVCQDSLSALCRLFNVLIRDSTATGQQQQQQQQVNSASDKQQQQQVSAHYSPASGAHQQQQQRAGDMHRGREMDLLVDAMNDYTLSSSSPGAAERVAIGAEASDRMIIRSAGAGASASERRRNSLSSVASGSSSSRGARDKKSDQDDDDDDNDDGPSDAEDESSSVRSTSGEEDDDDDYDSDDAPPGFQRAAASSRSSSGGSSAGSSGSDSNGSSSSSQRVKQRRDPNACLLDESNPMLGDLISPPLLPATTPSSGMNELNLDLDQDDADHQTHHRPMDESGFFVIGDDDVGAGIIDKSRGRHEPLVRKLIEGPISIVENHFKMTRPRTLPEMLANSLERYVLEEMTLVVNLFGGRDFHDDDTGEDEVAAAPDDVNTKTPATSGGQLLLDIKSSSKSERAFEATNELLDTISGKNNAGAENQSIRARAGSVASPRRQMSFGGSGGGGGSLKRSGGVGGGGGRRKHFSESGDLASGAQHVEQQQQQQRVRFGEGAVNLWESLDLMSSPDFLGVRGRPGPSQPALSSDSKQAGGTWRQTDVCIQLTLSKVKLLYELADGSGAELVTPSCLGHSAQATRAAMAWRFMLFIQDIEVRDRVAASDINKVLYEYCNESMPKRSTQMLTIKNTATINPTDGCEECDLRVSLKPLRLNIDQDTLLFLIEFFTTLTKSLARQQSIYAARNVAAAAAASGSPSSSVATKTTTSSSSTARSSGKSMASSEANRVASASGPAAPAAVNLSKRTSSDGDNSPRAPCARVTRNDAHTARTNNLECAQVLADDDDDALCNHARRDSLSSFASSTGSSGGGGAGGTLSAQAAAAAGNNSSGAGDLKRRKQPASKDESISSKTSRDGGAGLPTHCHTDGETSAGAAGGLAGPECREQPIYIKSFTFSPDVPIRIDYHAKHLDFEQGALAGILMGLAHLDHSELILRRVQAKHGMRGLDRVLVFAINSWLADIKRNQLPSILSGVGPMYSVIQLFQGMRDLIWMPIDHYRKDGRLVRGLQRGASSFSSSTAMAAINLVNRFISIVQCTAQIAHDIVTPPSMASGHRLGGQLGVSGSGADNNQRRRRRARPQLKSALASGQAANNALSSSSASSCLLANNSRLNHTNAINGLTAAGHLAGGSGGLNQPRNFCEGVAVGFSILKEGFNDTARNVTVGMQAEDMRSAVGELVRQIPSTLLNPIISATEGAQSVLVGIRNQIAPDARRDDQEKWKGRVRGK